MPASEYTTRPQTVTAIEWTGDNVADVLAFHGDTFGPFEGATLQVETPLGRMTVDVGDYLVRKGLGVFPVKPDDFAATYEAAA